MTDDTIDLPVHACRDCGEEYRPGIEVCADCGGPIEDRFPGAVAKVDDASRAAVPEVQLAGHHILYRAPYARDLVPMADRLHEAGIECWIAEERAVGEDTRSRYLLLVKEADAAGALAAVSDLIAPHETGGDLHAVAARFDKERGYLQCPACGTSPPSGALECPECGLGLGGGEADAEPSE